MSIDPTAELLHVPSGPDGTLSNFRNHLTKAYELVSAAIDATMVLLPPLVTIVTGYVTVDPRIADVLREFVQRAAIDANHKLVWRVKHRDDPTGPDVAEVLIEYCMKKRDNRYFIPNTIITLFCIDRNSGETSCSHVYGISPCILCDLNSESDGLTVRLNDAWKVNYSLDIKYDMHAIALTGLHRMINPRN